MKKKKSRWFATTLALFLILATVATVSAITYRVRRGDTLYGIARRYNSTVEEIAQVNNIANPNLIYVDQQLEIPSAGENPTPPPSPPPGETTTYIVQPGDTLFRISQRFNTTVAAIAQANNITNINLISVGQRLVIPGGTGPIPPPPPAPGGDFELGGQSTGFGNVDLMKDIGMTWIKVQYKWSPGDSPDNVAGIIETAHNSDLKILLSIPGANTYPDSIDFNGYVEFLRGVAELGPDGIEVWNEMNIDFEWPAGTISPTSYVNNMLRPAYSAIKEVNSDILVVAGALAPTGFDNNTNAWADSRYLAGMRAAGAANYMDCMGAHHNAGATSPSATSGHPAPYHYSWYFQPTLNLYYNSFGGARRVCFTELGYLSGEGFEALPPNFSWAQGTSVAEQAAWLAEAVRLSANSGKVRLLIIYNIDFTEYDVAGDPQAGYAIVRPGGDCPACGTLRAAMGG